MRAGETDKAVSFIDETLNEIIKKFVAAAGYRYMIDIDIFLVDGETKTRIRAGSSFCLHPHETHYLMNAGKSHAKVLWISTPPSF